MSISTLAHLSDLHLGRSDETARATEALCQAIEESAVDHVVVTGDLTHRGKARELDDVFRIFSPLIAARRVTFVPGNHDRLGDEVAHRVMPRDRPVDIVQSDGLHLVRVDSTGPHNRFLLAGHGSLSVKVIEQVEAALDNAPAHHLKVVLLHHHLLPLPEETIPERLATSLGWPFATELQLGAALLERLRGRCDLVLHGHRHVPSEKVVFGEGPRPLGLFNAGSTTALGRFRLFSHFEGQLLGTPRWLSIKEENDEPTERASVLSIGGRDRTRSHPARGAALVPA